MKKIKFVILCSFLATMNAFAIENSQDEMSMPSDTQEVVSTQASDAQAVKFKALGHRWAASMDAQGKILAIYDLSFANIRARLHLGHASDREANAKLVAQMLKDSAEGSESGDLKILEKALKKLEGKGETNNSVFAAGWHKLVSWNDKSSQNTSNAPESFNLNDINLSALVDEKDMNELEQKIDEAVYSVDKVKFSFKEFLKQFVYEKQPDGSYEMYFVPNSTEVGLGAITKAKKVADLVSIKAPYYQTLKWNIVKSGVSKLVGMIKVPVVSTILDLAVKKYFDLTDQMIVAHNLMVIEMIDAAKSNEQFASFKQLSSTDLDLTTKSVIYNLSGMFGIVKYMFKSPMSSYDKMMKDQKRIEIASSAWFKSNNISLTELSSRFAIGVDSQSNKNLFLNARECRLKLIGGMVSSNEYVDSVDSEADKAAYNCAKRGPTVSINYQKPEAERTRRIAVESIGMIVNFASQFIPTFGSVVDKAYDYFLVKPIMLTKEWESRLMAHLEDRMMNSDENRSMELDTLFGQRLNPRELNRVDTEKLIKQRQAEMGIGGSI